MLCVPHARTTCSLLRVSLESPERYRKSHTLRSRPAQGGESMSCKTLPVTHGAISFTRGFARARAPSDEGVKAHGVYIRELTDLRAARVSVSRSRETPRAPLHVANNDPLPKSRSCARGNSRSRSRHPITVAGRHAL